MAPRPGYKHQRLDRCRRCGSDIPYVAHTTHKAFCGDACRDTWWDDLRSKRVTRSEVAEKITGTKVPEFRWTDTQSAWLAAMIDGEGTIGIWRERRSGNTSGYRYKAVITINNTSVVLLDAIAAMVDGSYTRHQMPLRPQHKQVYRLTLRQRAVLPVLERIAPFLVIKKEQADITMQFCRALADAPVRTAAFHETFETLYQQMKALNQRGVPLEV